jgi:TfoX/Sxy family transcriptional regulator of competence genes
MHGPKMNGCVVDGDAALGHHLLEIPQAQAVGQVPLNAEQDNRSVKMPAFEHATLHP